MNSSLKIFIWFALLYLFCINFVSASSPSLQNDPSSSSEKGLPSLENRNVYTNITNNYYNNTYINQTGGGNPFDQNLNTTADNVSFAGAFVNVLNIHFIQDELGNSIFNTNFNNFNPTINFINGLTSLLSQSNFIDILIDDYTDGLQHYLKFNSPNSADESTISANDTDFIFNGSSRNIFFVGNTNLQSSGGNSSWNQSKADSLYISVGNLSNYNNLLNQNCGSGKMAYGIYSNGSLICTNVSLSAPNGGGATSQVIFNNQGNLSSDYRFTFNNLVLTVPNLVSNGLTASKFVFTDSNKLLNSSIPSNIINDILPSQTGKSGNVLKTDGTNTAWTDTCPNATRATTSYSLDLSTGGTLTDSYGDTGDSGEFLMAEGSGSYVWSTGGGMRMQALGSSQYQWTQVSAPSGDYTVYVDVTGNSAYNCQSFDIKIYTDGNFNTFMTSFEQAYSYGMICNGNGYDAHPPFCDEWNCDNPFDATQVSASNNIAVEITNGAYYATINAYIVRNSDSQTICSTTDAYIDGNNGDQVFLDCNL